MTRDACGGCAVVSGVNDDGTGFAETQGTGHQWGSLQAPGTWLPASSGVSVPHPACPGDGVPRACDLSTWWAGTVGSVTVTSAALWRRPHFRAGLQALPALPWSPHCRGPWLVGAGTPGGVKGRAWRQHEGVLPEESPEAT